MSERDMRKLHAALAKALGENWKDIVEWLRDQNQLAVIEERITFGQIDNVVAEVEAAAQKFAAEATEAYVTAGQKAAVWLDKKVTDALVRFDVTNHRAVAHAEVNQLEFVRGFSQEQRTKTQQILVDGLRVGTNPRDMARDLRDSIGLTPTQEQHVRNYRRALTDADFSGALRRELRDGRSDKLLRRLQRDGGTLSAEQIDTMVEKYRRNYISHRATVIARTEALRAANDGLGELFEQAIERGDVDPAELVKTWHAGPRTRHARDDHQAMNNVSVGALEDFVMPDGTRMARPGDPRGGATHNASCRCTVSTSYAALGAA